MPFKSEEQRKFMWKFHPRIAHAWAHGKSSVTGKKEPRARSKAARGHRGIGGGTKNLPRYSRAKKRS